jgi:DNA-binding NtrC family response regulator
VSKVLVVDDEQACRDSLRLLLSLEGFQVRVAAGAREAVAATVADAPDVLVVDWLLAGPMDGLQVIEAVRVANPKLQCVVVTGYLSAEVEARIKAVPGAQYLAKPFVPAELIAAVRRAAAAAE